VIHAFRSARVDDFAQLRAMLYEVEALPTVQRGLAALAIDSIFEVPHRAVHTISHPIRRPCSGPLTTSRASRPQLYDPAEFEW